MSIINNESPQKRIAVAFGKTPNVLKVRQKSKLNGLGGQTSFWVAGLQYEFQRAICPDGGIQNGFLNKLPIIPSVYFEFPTH